MQNLDGNHVPCFLPVHVPEDKLHRPFRLPRMTPIVSATVVDLALLARFEVVHLDKIFPELSERYGCTAAFLRGPNIPACRKASQGYSSLSNPPPTSRLV